MNNTEKGLKIDLNAKLDSDQEFNINLNKKVCFNNIMLKSNESRYELTFYDKFNNVTRKENSDGSWTKFEYDENAKLIFVEKHDGKWEKYTRNEKGLVLNFENSNGFWYKYVYNLDGKVLAFSNSAGVHYHND